MSRPRFQSWCRFWAGRSWCRKCVCRYIAFTRQTSKEGNEKRLLGALQRRTAERVGFEPTNPHGLHDFESCAFDGDGSRIMCASRPPCAHMTHAQVSQPRAPAARIKYHNSLPVVPHDSNLCQDGTPCPVTCQSRTGVRFGKAQHQRLQTGRSTSPWVCAAHRGAQVAETAGYEGSPDCWPSRPSFALSQSKNP